MPIRSSSPGAGDGASRLARASRRARAAARTATREALLAGLVHDGRILACAAHHACVEQVVRRLQAEVRPPMETLPRALMVPFWAALMCRECERTFVRTVTPDAAAAVRPPGERRPDAPRSGWLRRDSQLWLGAEPEAGTAADGDTRAAANGQPPRTPTPRGGIYLIKSPDLAPADAMHDLTRLFSPHGESLERGHTCSVRRLDMRDDAICRVTWPVDEWLCLILQGCVDVTVDGAPPARLSARRDQLLWLPRLPDVAEGPPPIALRAVGGPVQGMVMLYRQDGIDLTTRTARAAASSARDWTHARVAAYWDAARHHIPPLRDARPFVANLPLAPAAARELDACDRRGPHERAVPGWPTPTGTGTDAHASAFDLALLDFPAAAMPRPPGEIELSRRDGCRDVVVPLAGRVRYALAAAQAEDGDRHRAAYFARAGRALDLGDLSSAAARHGRLPDVLAFDSAQFHGFAAAGRDRAWMLRMRCLAHRPAPRR